MVALLIPLAPLAAAALVAVWPGRRSAPALTSVASLLAFGGAVHTVLRITEGGTSVRVLGDVVAVDGLGALVAGLVTLVGLAASLFSWGDVDVPEFSRRIRYYVSFNLFLFSLLLVPLLQDVALVWIAVELTTLLSVFLVSFEGTREALEAAWKYVVLTLMGAVIALLGVLLLYGGVRHVGGHAFTWDGLRAAAPSMPPGILLMGFLLVLAGFGAKTGLVPLHTWLPDAHSQAPSPVCALLSGVETTVVLYTILRLLPVIEASPGLHAVGWVVGVGLLSVGASAFLMIQTRDYKRLLAFSTVEHMGIVLTAAGLGGPAAWYGVAYQMAAHAVTKALCFFAAGETFHCTGTREIARVRGLIRLSPAAGVGLLGGGLAIAGAPPFAVFMGEFAILRGAVAGGHLVPASLLALFIGVAFCALMTPVTRMVFGTPRASRSSARGRVPRIMALVMMAVPVVTLGLFTPKAVHGLFRMVASSMGR